MWRGFDVIERRRSLLARLGRGDINKAVTAVIAGSRSSSSWRTESPRVRRRLTGSEILAQANRRPGIDLVCRKMICLSRPATPEDD